MTREEILSMSAGSELDKLVAEKVMGWEITGQCWFEPSQDISEAWEVVEEMDKKGFDLKAESTGDLKEVKFINAEKGIFGEGYSYSMPLSICKAALLAVMKE